MILALAVALAMAPEPRIEAAATLEARSASAVSGSVHFTQRGADLAVTIELVGATPGDHAVHVHEKGDCSAPDGTSAGGHFNPEHKNHGDAMGAERHPGDFGNVTVGADGKGKKEIVVTGPTLGPGALSIAALAVIVHEKADDFGQPTGNAGGRQACGIIVVGP